MTIAASPSPELVLQSYEAGQSAAFDALFEPPSDSRFAYLFLGSQEKPLSLLVTDLSHRAVVGLKYRWTKMGNQGKPVSSTMSTDSFFLSPNRPVMNPRSRYLIAPSTLMAEELAQSVVSGTLQGGLGSGSRTSNWFEGVDEISFQVDVVIFEDGEIAGPDPDRYIFELHARRQAASFVARQIRLAQAENRDPTPVLNALMDMPKMREDHLAEWISRHAGSCRRSPFLEAQLKHLEDMPELPKFYRKQ